MFWKILIIFWIIFVIAFQTTWIAFSFYVENNRSEFSFVHIPTKVNMIAQLLHVFGKDDAEKFVQSLPEVEQSFFQIVSLDEFESLLDGTDQMVEVSDSDNVVTYREIAVGPDGVSYLVSFTNFEQPTENTSLFHMPIPLVLMGLFGGLLFSLFLAWNLTRPMKLLQKGFFRVSQGDLSVRLFSKLKRRHDELSDLARDFDAMVEKLNILITGRQQLLHDVSHELRTPLARLQLAIGLAQQNKKNIDDSLQRIELESQRLDRLIGEILSFSRTEGSNALDEYFDLKDLIKVVIDDANYEAEPMGIVVKAVLSPVSNSIIKGNAEQIRRAIENIIRNSIRFSKPGQEVEVSLRELDKYLQISVKDQGPGVEEHKLSSIFEPFVRIQSPQLGKGYGLGLAIVRKIIHAHNGTINASNIENGGLNVTIKLPFWK
ncbi:ATP-binding protein [Utexia brackfieldae]|uniref:ATP-binding protein n=1 Tax=Utexia brackfieldae TaxID=3074108 RepID=UPI00370D1B3D